MNNREIIEQLENAIELIKQDGKDWLDDRDIPILEACIKSLTALDKIQAEIENYKLSEDELSEMDEDSIKWGMKIAYDMVDKYRAEIEPQESEAEDGNNSI